jgi:hypothetical protein
MVYFLNWGGFNPTKLDTSRGVHELDLFKPGAREENARMRAALQLCSRITSTPIPQRVVPTNTIAEGQTVPTPGPSLETARIFAGLYDKMPPPAIGRLKRVEVDEEDYCVEETIAASSPATPTLPSEAASPDVRGSTPSDSSSSLSSESSTSIPSPQPIKRPPISPEEKQKLDSQLNAARLLQKATTMGARRKQAKPAVVEPAKKPKPQQWIPDSDRPDGVVVEEKQEPKGFLAKLSSLFGR